MIGDALVESTGNRRTVLGPASRFSITLAGTARFQIANLLAAMAACRALGIGVETITSALTHFGAAQQNRGRVNFYKVNGGHVVVDYGHNVGAFQAICDMTRAWNYGETIGVVSLPGDRSDALLEQASRVAGCGFDRLIIREDADSRGRAPGEVAQRFYETVHAMHPALDPVVILDEFQAYQHALRLARPGTVVTLFFDDYEIVQHALQEAGAVPAEFLPELFIKSPGHLESAAS
jgi:cyanophycin synthetase